MVHRSCTATPTFFPPSSSARAKAAPFLAWCLLCGLFTDCNVKDTEDYRFGQSGNGGAATSGGGKAGGGTSGGGRAGSGGSNNGGTGTQAGGATNGRGGTASNQGGDDNTPGGSSTEGGSASGGVAEAGAAGQPDPPAPICPAGTFDCNGEAEDGCEASAVEPPSSVQPLAPMRGAYSGSLHASSRAPTLRPKFFWTKSTTQCGAVRYELELDDTCAPGKLAECSFDSPTARFETTDTELQPADDLEVSRSVPVGSFYAWRVRACDDSERCSEWSDVSYLHVGRTLQDLNGDGFADVVASSKQGLEFYQGSTNIEFTADARLANTNLSNVRFIGDVNSDGFADLAALGTEYTVCASSGYFANVIYGDKDFAKARVQPLCRTAGTSSVLLATSFIGDLDGDGFADLGLGRGRDVTENRFFVFAGGASDVESTPFIDLDVSVENKGNYTIADGSSDRRFMGGGDFNADGFADVVLGGAGHGAGLTRYFGLFGGKASKTQFDGQFDHVGCSTSHWVTQLGDIDRDGFEDWGVSCADTSATFGLIYGATTFPKALEDSFVRKGLNAISKAIDFDNNGVLEVFIGSTELEKPIMWRHGSFDVTSPTRFQALSISRVLANADHDGNGRDDLLALDSTSIFWVGSFTSFSVSSLRLTAPPDVTEFTGLAY